MDDIRRLVEAHEAWRGRACINLQPSENVTSLAVRAILASDLGHRYTLPLRGPRGEPGNDYGGTRYLDEIEALGESLAKDVFRATYATLKPLSGHIAGFLTLLATCRRGDTILVLDTRHGGYHGYTPTYLPDLLGLKAEFLPFHEARWTVDPERAARAIAGTRPRLVLLAGSHILFPYPLRALRDACDDVGAVLAYDGSHVLGLIAGGEFQRPLDEGADILFGSTHKSFFGPQGALLLTNRDDLFGRVLENLTWRTIDNAHWNRIAATAQALAEAKAFGPAYAEQVVANAWTLATHLARHKVPVRFRDAGYTRSHQVQLDEARLRSEMDLTPEGMSARLEANDLIVDRIGRIGTSEVTRMGATEDTIAEIASLVARAARGETVRSDVARVRSRFNLNFAFETQAAKADKSPRVRRRR